MFVIIGPWQEDDEMFLYWSNEDGFGHRDSATLFTQEERDTLNLPTIGIDDNVVAWVKVK